MCCGQRHQADQKEASGGPSFLIREATKPLANDVGPEQIRKKGSINRISTPDIPKPIDVRDIATRDSISLDPTFLQCSPANLRRDVENDVTLDLPFRTFSEPFPSRLPPMISIRPTIDACW